MYSTVVHLSWSKVKLLAPIPYRHVHLYFEFFVSGIESLLQARAISSFLMTFDGLVLHRLATVTKEGKYIRSNKPRQLGYGAMVFIRQGIVADASIYLSRAVTIAVRYSAVRRQFGGKDGKLEIQVEAFTSLMLCATLDQT